MLVTLLTSRVSAYHVDHEGDTVDLPAREALAMISAGSALPASAEPEAATAVGLVMTATLPRPETATRKRTRPANHKPRRQSP